MAVALGSHPSMAGARPTVRAIARAAAERNGAQPWHTTAAARSPGEGPMKARPQARRKAPAAACASMCMRAAPGRWARRRAGRGRAGAAAAAAVGSGLARPAGREAASAGLPRTEA